MPEYTLTQLQYSDDREGPWRLYIYENGYHSGGQWFARQIKYPDEEISIARAMILASEALVNGREIRITDPGDMLVYHALNGRVLWPEGENFWQSIDR